MTLKSSPRSTGERRREREMQNELLKFHRDQTDPIATNITKKRVREPRVDLESNPFCADRQLADSYQQLNFNKNPRFYSVSVQDGARVEQNPRNHSSFVNQSTDLLANSLFDARARPEFSTLPPATSYTPAVAHFAVPKVVSVDPSNLRKPSSSKDIIESNGTKDTKASNRHLFPPGHKQYSAHLTSQSVTFGHRPSSAARMFDHLSSSISGANSPRNPGNKMTSRRASSTPVRTGMSVMELTQLLAPAQPKKSSSLGSKSSSKTLQHWKARSTETSLHSYEAFSLDKEVDDELFRQDADRKKKTRELKLENSYINYVYNPPRELKPGQFPPPDQTTAQLIDKYRKLAVGKMPDIF
ncbi:uncharacterized protein PITG_13316 [Phytophthora infestans T30-4]|uniref:Uncharacterized protein n=2 Tax=Phytophthora infestans TaxID=4787 RepID=D0NLP4_PHYIT|nr:uncharacterized protein PITG_13316 [Phytophthora infestans T30-4]EEY60591.1 conserved hypothetical protein [Phytophthora infestans T30-4]KAF4037939.1 hypothetical protein GN244_ATG09954 [Phytophthora infestans]KAF4150203.1 hypothetical protein GN958_ATG00624 [Phytophthora infestans]|eukprot:XP_002899964.1 conserved hypothetical protein [Phytophthora infestans T30-4]